MIPIKIDISQTADEFNLSKQEVDLLKRGLLNTLSNELLRQWGEQTKVLKKTREKYLNGLKIIRDGNRSGVELTGWLPNRVESGLSPFDMKAGFLRSSKAKQGKNGPYLTIPFRYAIPTAEATSSLFAGKLPQEVFSVAKKLPLGGRLVKTDIKGIVDNIPKTKAFLEDQEAISSKYEQYEGLTRGKEQHHGEYTTFRRVSLNSPEDSWIHSGIKARRLADKALNKMTPEIGTITDTVVQKFLKENM